jgi:hypothetical protein
MLFPVLNGWFDNDFNDNFFNGALSRVNTTSPAVNVKEDADKYTMEVAVPGIKKEYVRIDLNKDGELELAIENKLEHKEEDSKKERRSTRSIICAVSSLTATTSRHTLCPMMSTRSTSPLRWRTVSLPSRCRR